MVPDAEKCSELANVDEQRAAVARALLPPYAEASDDSVDEAAEGARTHALLWAVSDEEEEASAVHRRAADEAA